MFLPRPNVESGLVEIVRRPAPAVGEENRELLFDLLRTAFQQRRKTLRRSLLGRVPPRAYAAAGIDDGARPEELDVAAWGRLTAWRLARHGPSVRICEHRHRR